MDKEWSEKNRQMQAFLSKKDTFHQAIALLIDLRSDIFQQITQIWNGYPEEAFFQMPFARAAGYACGNLEHCEKAFLKVHDRLHQKYDFSKTQELLGRDLAEGLRILEEN